MAEKSHVDVEKFRKILLEERKRLQRTLSRPTDEQLGGEDESLTIGELSDYPDHPADLGTETFEMEKAFSVRQNARDLLERVEDALRKIDGGTYGICSNCRKPIPEGRLLALPSAIYCVPCQSILEG